MTSVTNLGVGLVVFALVLKILSSFSASVQESRKARAHGCSPATRIPAWGLGIQLFRHLRAADRAGHRSKAYQKLHQKHGKTIEFNVLGEISVQTAHPQNIQAICTSQFEDFGVEPMRGRIGAPFMDRGIFMVDGDYWKYSRAMIRPIFSRAEVADLLNFEQYVKRLLKLVPEDGEAFDLLPLAKRLFMDSATEFIFGKSADSLLPDAPKEMEEFAQAFDRSLLGLALTLILGPFKWLVYIDPYWIKAYKTVHRWVDSRVHIVLQREMESTHSAVALTPDTQDDDGGSRSKYVLINELVKFTKDPYELRHQLLNLFFPARDTSALAFGNVLFYLSRHPKWWQKLRDEVVPLGDTPLEFELVRGLKTTRAIVNEAIRLHPAASRLGKVALKDTKLPKGGGPDGESPLFVPKGRVIELDVYCVQHDSDYYGSDAEEFRPERWADGRPLWEAKWQYEPFLGGIRMCPAHTMVLTQVSYLLIRFAQEFERIECRDPVKEYVEQIAMTVESRNGAKIALWRDKKQKVKLRL